MIHGPAVHTFKKTHRGGEQTVVLYEDGCVVTTIVSLTHSDNLPHTSEPYRWNEQTLADLTASGFSEDDYDFL